MSQIQETISAGRNEFRNKQSQTEGEPCSTELEPSSTKETRARPIRTPSDLVSVLYERIFCQGKEVEEYSCSSILQREISFTAISKLVMRLVRYDQEERETDGAVHWNTIKSQIAESIWIKKEHEIFRRRIGFDTVMKEVTRRNSARIPNIF